MPTQSVAEKVTCVVTHKGFHLDEAFAALLAELFGQEVYPGIADAVVEFVSANAPLDEKFKGPGCAHFGVGGGKGDEHPAHNGQRKSASASQMVADELNLGSNRAVRELLKYVNRTDNTATAHPFELPSMMKCYHFQNPGSERKLWSIVKLLLLAKLREIELWYSDRAGHTRRQQVTYAGSKIFYDLCMTYTDRAGGYLREQAQRVRGGETLQPYHLASIMDCVVMMMPEKASQLARCGRLLIEAKWWEQTCFHQCADEWSKSNPDWHAYWKGIRVAAIQCDNPQIWKWARANKQVGLLIVRNSRGQVQMLVDKKTGLNLMYVIEELRAAEQKLAGEEVYSDRDLLMSPGKIPGAASVWYYDHSGNIFNGSTLASPDTPATKIPFEMVMEIAWVNLIEASDVDAWEWAYGEGSNAA